MISKLQIFLSKKDRFLLFIAVRLTQVGANLFLYRPHVTFFFGNFQQ